MSTTALFCDACREIGMDVIADYVRVREEDTLEGPAFGDPDAWPSAAPDWRALCQEHYNQLPSDTRIHFLSLQQCLADFSL